MPKKSKNVLTENVVYDKKTWKKRTLLCTPTAGWIRFEWALHRFGQIIPMNWEQSQSVIPYAAIGMSIDDAYNSFVKQAVIDLKVEWVIFIEDDVLIPADCFKKFEEYQRKGNVPIVSGLYYLKADPTLPLIFRGRGNGAYTDFKIGQKVWCDGYGMGCLMIHNSILEYMYHNSEEYTAHNGDKLRRVFETPQKVFYDPQFSAFGTLQGTQDLFFYDRLKKEKVYEKTGWKRYQKKEFPLLCDTSIFCKHIDRNTGRQFP